MNNINIPGYTILNELGRGGMASVYLANQNCVDRMVALKIMDPSFASDPSFGERFIREAKIVAQLSHPNIVSVIEVGVHENTYYLAMDYHSGGDLKNKIEQGLHPNTALEYLQQIAKALEHAHSKGYIHRDIKPENILFNESGDAILSDFGIARAQRNTTNMTAIGSVVGTPRYMSPEQAKGIEVDFKADLYCLGVVFYEMLTGSVPYDADTDVAIGIKHISDPLPQLVSINTALAIYQPIIDTLMAKTPDARCPSAKHLYQIIDSIKSGAVPNIPKTASAADQTVITPAASRPQYNSGSSSNSNQSQHLKHSQQKKSKTSIIAGLLCVILACAGGGAYFYLDNQSATKIKIKTTAINFTTIPDGASVVIDGNNIGATPLRNHEIEHGAHNLEIKHPHYVSVNKSLDISATSNSDQHFILKRGKGAISVFSDPENATIFLNDKKVDTRTPFTIDNLETGNHLIRVEHKGFFSKEVSIDLQTEKVEKLVLNLKPKVNHDQFLTEDQKRIRALLAAADKDLKENRLATPKGKNAYERYLKVLKISPQNQKAQQGVLKVAERYADLAENSLLQKNYIKAAKYLTSAKQINPKLKRYNKLKAKLSASMDKTFSVGEKFQDRLVSGSLGPEMIVVPAGSFKMGDITGKGMKHEKPVREVTISKNFAIGTKEVTFEEYDRFANDMGAPLPNDSGWGRSKNPVIYIDWNLAKAYTLWLSKQTGFKYRLPTEAEWEYAARAGTETTYIWGNDLKMDMANCKSCKSDRSHNKTTPVGSYKPNAFGLYDTSGNVWEWVEDCWNNTYEYAPTDGSARLKGDCSQRVLRGGSWLNQSKSIRTASRSRDKKTAHFYFFGFRVVREL